MHERETAIEAIIESLTKGEPEYMAAKNAGIAFNTFWRWKNEVPGLAERVAEAKRARIPLIEDALYKAALSGKVLACLAILEKEDRGWRDRAKELAPQQQTFVFTGGAAAILSLMKPEQRNDLLTAMVARGHLPNNIKMLEAGPGGENGSNGTNGNGAH